MNQIVEMNIIATYHLFATDDVNYTNYFVIMEKNNYEFRILTLRFVNGTACFLFEEIFMNKFDAERKIQILKDNFKKDFPNGTFVRMPFSDSTLSAMNYFIKTYPLNCESIDITPLGHRFWQCDTEIPLQYGRFEKGLVYEAKEIYAPGTGKGATMIDEDGEERTFDHSFLFDNFSCAFYI